MNIDQIVDPPTIENPIGLTNLKRVNQIEPKDTCLICHDG